MSATRQSRIAGTFERLKRERRKALIPYFTAGDPHPAADVPIMHALASAGADVIELGVPFSDPMADGPTIQRASERALAQGVTLRGILDAVRVFRTNDDKTPVVLMGYANPIEAIGQDHFVALAAESGVDGVLVVDYPPEESQQFAASLAAHGMDMIFLVAPTTTASRMKELASRARGYIYYVSLTGVTGATNIDRDAVARKIAQLRGYTKVPIGVGFGIRDADTACAIAAVADAVVIGSALVSCMEGAGADEAPTRAHTFLSAIRNAMDRA
jgi:tryptophan synthase alpha chain